MKDESLTTLLLSIIAVSPIYLGTQFPEKISVKYQVYDHMMG